MYDYRLGFTTHFFIQKYFDLGKLNIQFKIFKNIHFHAQLGHSFRITILLNLE